MDASRRRQSHQVELLACLLCIAVCVDNALVLQDVPCLTGFVDFHEVLIDDTAGADIQVSHLRVAHLAGRQANIFTRSLQLRMCADRIQII